MTRRVAYNHLTSNMRKWNNCFTKLLASVFVAELFWDSVCQIFVIDMFNVLRIKFID